MAEGKPDLTGHNVTNALNGIKKEPHGHDAQRLRANWRQYLRDSFQLSHAQQGHLDAIPANHVDLVRDALSQTLDEGGDITVSLASESTDHQGRLTFAKAGSPQGAVTPRLNIIIAHCTFDADCGNWQCGWGPSL